MEQRILGDYTIIKSIGHGSLGIVYLAEHRFMKRQYALKVLPEELSSDRGFIQRFEEDVGVLASLEHPNIVKIHNISFDQGQYFLVLDCIVDALGETTNLAQYVLGLRRHLEEDELFHILRQVADPLDYAHSKKIGGKDFIHRCLKLNNILVGKSSQGIDIYISDFGLSRIIGAGAVLTRTYKNVAEALGIGLQVLTQKSGLDRYPNPPVEQQKLLPLHTSFLQNYAFLAPEQKRLDLVHPIDAKADVYAFGVLAYYLLMNELPEGMFDMPSIKGRYRYKWDELIIKCLQNNPAKRPDNLLAELDAIRFEKPSFIMEDSKIVIKQMHSKEFDDGLSAEIAAKYPVIESESSIPSLQPISVPSKVVVVDSELSCEIAKPIDAPIRSKLDESLPSLKPNLQTPQLERPQTDLDPGANKRLHNFTMKQNLIISKYFIKNRSCQRINQCSKRCDTCMEKGSSDIPRLTRNSIK